LTIPERKLGRKKLVLAPTLWKEKRVHRSTQYSWQSSGWGSIVYIFRPFDSKLRERQELSLGPHLVEGEQRVTLHVVQLALVGVRQPRRRRRQRLGGVQAEQVVQPPLHLVAGGIPGCQMEKRNVVSLPNDGMRGTQAEQVAQPPRHLAAAGGAPEKERRESKGGREEAILA
jgi:hypothetical protein